MSDRGPALAIKGKGKTRPRPVARAPRRAPVEVKPPVLRRRWVQVVTAFVAGILAAAAFVWVTNGLRAQDADERAAARGTSRRAAASAYQRLVESAIAEVGTVSPGAAPVVFTELQALIERLAEGRVPDDAARVVARATEDAQAARDLLEGYDLAGSIRDQGFQLAETNYLLNSRARMLQALELYGHAADLAGSAAEAGGAEVRDLGRHASRLQRSAGTIFQEGYSDFQQALFAAGLIATPQAAGVPGVTGTP